MKKFLRIDSEVNYITISKPSRYGRAIILAACSSPTIISDD